MGDMGDYYREWDELKKAAKERRLKDSEIHFNAECAPDWVRHTPYHWSRDLNGQQLDFWPSTGRWRWMNKSYRGTPRNLSGFILNREAPQ